MDLLRSNVTRNIGGILNPKLYLHALSGTKDVIASYQNTVLEAFEEILTSPNISKNEKIEFFGELKHAYGRSALLLSGGGMCGLAHLGVVKTLLKYKRLPKILSGASAGALCCCIIGTTKEEDLIKKIEQCDINFGIFEQSY